MTTNEILVQAPAFVELEGKEVLRFIKRGENFAEYSIVGFDNQIRVIDYRQRGLAAIDIVLDSKQLELFPENFCFPSSLRILQSEQVILIELFDLLSDFEPKLMLWITTNLTDPIPDYEYLYLQIQPLSSAHFSFVSLFNYRRYHDYFDGIVDSTVLQLKVET